MPFPANATIVVGAGVAGLSTALHLARRGFPVTVLDGMPLASGASFGNSGFLVSETAMPAALPGMYRKVPGWLLDPGGPLVVKRRYLATAAPFLLRWLKASRLAQVHKGSDALRAIHQPCFDEWRRLVGDAAYADLIRRRGQVYVWEGAGPHPTPVEDELRARHGVEARDMPLAELRETFPGISPTIGRALFIPKNGCTVNPGRLLLALADAALAAGATLAHERVLAMWPDARGGWRVMTSASATRRCANLVVAAGAWSADLLRPLGVHIPLESERGYHVMLPQPSVTFDYPILHKTGFFGVNSMEHGLRLGGTVEFAGLEAPADPSRCELLVRQAKVLFPGIEHGEPRFWMGHRPSTPDTVPVIGPVAGHAGLFACFGHGHSGLTGGPASARLVAELVAGDTPHIDPAPYRADRFD